MPMTKPKEFALAALFGAAIAAAAPAISLAQEAKPREAIITVTGEGESVMAPDMAVITLAVVRQAKTAGEALTENNKAMSEVLAALKAGGIAERDLQTSGFSIQPQYNYPQPKEGEPQQPQLIGYLATNSLTVRVRDLTKLGAIIDQAVGLGVNQGGDIQFTNDKPEGAIDEARKIAVTNAIAKAKTLTEAAGVKLGRIVEIAENTVRPVPQPVYRAAMMKEASDASVPVAGGENSYNVTINVTFALEQ